MSLEGVTCCTEVVRCSLWRVSFTDLTEAEAAGRLNASDQEGDSLEKHHLGDIDAEAKPTVQVGVIAVAAARRRRPRRCRSFLSEHEFVAIDSSVLNLAARADFEFFDELGGATDVEWVIAAAAIVAMLIGLRVAVVADDAVVRVLRRLPHHLRSLPASHHLSSPSSRCRAARSRAQQAMTTFLVPRRESLSSARRPPARRGASPRTARLCTTLLAISPSSPS